MGERFGTPMSQASKLAKKFGTEFIGRGIATISSSLLTILLARLLDPDSYGLFFLAVSVYGLAKIFSKLGIASSAGRYIAKYSETDIGQVPHIVRISFVFNALTIFVTGCVFAISSGFLSKIIGNPDLTPLLSLGVFFIVFSSLVTYVRLILQGFGEIELSSGIYAIDRVCRLSFTFGFVLLGYDVIGALMGYITSSILASLVGLLLIYVKFYRRLEKGSQEQGLRQRIVRYSIPLTATNTATVLDKRFDTVLIGFFLNPSAVAFYTAGRQIVQFIKIPMSSLGFTLSPMYGSQKARGESDKAARIYAASLSYGLLAYIPIGVGLALIAKPLITFVFGNEYLDAVPILQIFSVYIVLQAITEITESSLDYLGRARSRAIIQTITSILNVILNIVLIPLIGIVGAAIATVITHSIYTLSNVYMIHIELDLNTRMIIRNLAYSIVVAAAIATTVLPVISLLPGPVPLVIAPILGGGIWIILVQRLGVLDLHDIISSFT